MTLATIIGETPAGELANVGAPGAYSDVKGRYRAMCEKGGDGYRRLLLLSTRGLESRRKFDTGAPDSVAGKGKDQGKGKGKGKDQGKD